MVYLKSYFLAIALMLCGACTTVGQNETVNNLTSNIIQQNSIPEPAAHQPSAYLPLLQEKKVGLVVNHTSMVEKAHLVDFLLEHSIQINKIFTPEHGFKGTADAGEKVYNDVYKNIPIVSLYGKNKKPKPEQLQDVNLLVFDMQDVGARFYTYISTMHYVMEAAAENNIPLIVLDRPNPNGHFVDGPIREPEFESFVAKHPIPVVHGMTVGELAQMINGEAWLKNGMKCDLTVIPCQHYNHTKSYILPIKPSPNLPNQRSIYLYPSLCFFEGTALSIGRGTQQQFQVIGHPALKEMPYSFTPISSAGAKYPKLENETCYGLDLSEIKEAELFSMQQLNLNWLIQMYNDFPDKANFFLDNGFFDKLAGTKKLREQIENGWTEEQIRASWQDDLADFKQLRKKYLLYDE